MSEEEKKAIELLENIKNNSWTTKYIMSSDSKNAEILLNLIEKLQKEKEESTEEKQYYFEKYQYNLKQNESLTREFSNCIPIQKVKNKMKEDIKTNEHTILGRRNGKTLEYGKRLGRIEMCQELLEGRK